MDEDKSVLDLLEELFKEVDEHERLERDGLAALGGKDDADS